MDQRHGNTLQVRNSLVANSPRTWRTHPSPKIDLSTWSGLPAWPCRQATFALAVTYSAYFNICGYQYNGTYLFPQVKARHQENLRWTMDDLPGWQHAMLDELSHTRFVDAWVRIHDSGDFYSRLYLAAWLEIMRARQRTRFYAYTKEVAAFRELVEPNPPRNFWWVYSYGGTQDSTLDPAVDRVADVFPDEQSIAAAGWHSQDESDLLAVLGPAPVGIPANDIAHFKARQAGRRWSRWQAGVDAARAARRTGTRSATADGDDRAGASGSQR